jgi:hypothetical protein
MTYTIRHANGLNPITVSDNTFDNSTSVYLIGRNYSNYGELFDQNFLWIMEHWASNVSPANPTIGQIWYDLGGNGVPPLLKVYTPKKLWKSIVTVYSAVAAPLLPDVGDLWMDTSVPLSPGLYIYTVNGWLLVGPYTAGIGQIVSEVIYDKQGRPHNVISAKILGKRYWILSPDQTFEPRDFISGFSHIDPGLNLISQTALTNVRFTGRATDSDRLDGLYSWQFMRTDVDTGTVGTLTVDNDTGLFVGLNNHFNIGASGNNTKLTSNFVNGDLRFYVTRPAKYQDPGPFDAFDIYGNGNVSINANLTVIGVTNLSGGLAGGKANMIMQFGPDGAKVTYTPWAMSDSTSMRILNLPGKQFLGKVPSAMQITGSTTTTDWSSLDFRAYNQANPIGRIGLQGTTSGSWLYFGTSEDYNLGITNRGMMLDPQGRLVIQNNGYGGPLMGGALTLINNAQLIPTPNKHMRVNTAGDFEIISSDYTRYLLNLKDNGNFQVSGDIRADKNIVTPVARLKVTGATNDRDFLVSDGTLGDMKFSTITCMPSWCTPRQLNFSGDTSGQLVDAWDGSTDATANVAVLRLHTPRKIQATGDADWQVLFDGSTDVSGVLTLKDLQVQNTYYVVNVNNKGLVIGGTTDNPLKGKVPYIPYFDTDHTVTWSGAQWDKTTNGFLVTGYVSVSGDIIAFDTSDSRLKTNIEVIPDAVEKVKKLTGITYDWTAEAKKNAPYRDRREAGVLAQEVQQVLPEVVTEREDGTLALQYDRINALLIEAVKELTARIEKLEQGK